MKKLISIIISTLLVFGALPAFADEMTETLVWDVVYTDAAGNRIFTPSDTVYSSAHIYNGANAENVHMMVCAYNALGSIDAISVKTQPCMEGYNIIPSDGISVSDGGRVKTFVFDKNLTAVSIEKRSSFSTEISPLEITSFSLTVDGKDYEGIINDKTNEIFVDIPFYTIGQGKANLLHPDLSDVTESIEVSEGTVLKLDESGDFEEGIKYSVTDENGNSRIYTAYVIFTILQYSSDFEDSVVSGTVTGNTGAATLKLQGASGTVSPASEGDNVWLNVDKTATSESLSFTATDGCCAEMATDYFMEFDFKINSFSTENDGMYWYMGEMHQIIPTKTEGGYTLKYRHGLTGAIKEIPGIGEFSLGRAYHLRYCYSVPDEIGQLYIDNKYAGTLENIKPKLTSEKLSPIISFTAFKDAVINASFDNVVITYCETQPTEKTNLHIIGDSIVQTYIPSDKGTQGWGAYMTDRFDNTVYVKNHAISGQAAGCALYSGEPMRHDMAPIWPLLKYNLHPGDYVMISLGWNDIRNTQNPYMSSASDGYAPFKEYIGIMVEDTLNAGATPVLITQSILVPNGTSFDASAKPLADIMQSFADNDDRVICLDLTTALLEEFEKIGPAETFKRYHALNDYTHYNSKGASLLADIICSLLKESDCELKEHLVTPATVSEEPKLFTVTDSTGEYTFDGYVDKEAKKIYVEYIADIYANLDGDTNGYSKYYTDREGDFPGNLINATYNTTIGGSPQSGNISLSSDTPQTITIGSDTYSVILEKYIRGIVGNFDSGRTLTTNDDSDKNKITVNHYQHVSETYGTRYGGASLNATALKPVTSLQDTLYKPYYNISYALNAGRRGFMDTALRIEKKGNSSPTAPSLTLTESSGWGNNGKTILSFDIKCVEFDGNGLLLDVSIPHTSPLVYMAMIKGKADDTISLTYRSDAASEYGGYGKTIATINKNEWTNIKVIIDKDSSEYPFTICKDGEVILKTSYKTTSITPMPSSFGGNVLKFGTYSIANCTYYLDNVEFTCSQKK